MAKDIEVRKEKSTPRTPAVIDPLADMDRMINSFFNNPFGSLMAELQTQPRRAVSQVNETEDCFVLSAEIPGVPREEIDISVNGNMLTIRAEHKEEQNEENRGYRRSYRSFHQSFALPTTIDSEKIEASYENGILEVMLPKTEAARPKKIEVQAGAGGFLNRLMGTKNESNETNSKKH